MNSFYKILFIIGLGTGALLSNAKTERKWIPAAVQNFALSGFASAGTQQAAVKDSTIQMQGEEILKATVQFATEKETKFVMTSAEKIPNTRDGENNYTFAGELTYEGKTESVRFPAKVSDSDTTFSATVHTVLPDKEKTPVSISVSASKASRYKPWTNSSD